MKASYIPTLLELLELGAKDRPISITTTELGLKLGKSQQLASKHLEEMEREGLVERIRSGGKTYVKLTKKGISSGAALYISLSRVYANNENEKLEIVGFCILRPRRRCLLHFNEGVQETVSSETWF